MSEPSPVVPKPPSRPLVLAVFASATWSDQQRLRVWAKHQTVRPTCVLLTDDVIDANVVLLRQLNCSGVTAACVRMAGTERSEEAIAKAREKRDETMIAMADRVVVFAVPADQARWFQIKHLPIQVLMP